MRVGTPKEIKSHEYRVGLTPTSVREYASHGHEVLVETGAGAGIGASDADYEASGASIVSGSDEIFANCDMVVKVKEPQASEWTRLRPGQILFTYLHLAPDPEQTLGLIESGATCIAYETVTAPDGTLPLLAPMSEVAGRLSVQAAATYLMKPLGGRGVLLAGVPGVTPGRVTIIGGGVVGINAAKMSVGLGAETIILDRSLPRLRELDDIFGGRIITRYATKEALDEEVTLADAVIGAVLVPGAAAPKLVTRDMLKTMKQGSVLVDVAVDQGGCFETTRPTTHDDPVFQVDEIVHYCVANMPGAVPRTSSYALNNATLAFGLAIADKGVRQALADDPHLREGLNVIDGKVTYRAVAEALGHPFVAPETALGLHY